MAIQIAMLPVFASVPYLKHGACVQFVVGLGDKVAPTDVEEGMRVG